MTDYIESRYQSRLLREWNAKSLVDRLNDLFDERDKEAALSDRTERTKAFLNGLTELTRKYDIQIGACGCCDSPFLLDGDGYSGRYIAKKGDDERITWVSSYEDEE